MIGDDVRVLLGMIPVRDRAGIARSNMAIEAEKAAAADGNAEGQALTRQGFDFTRAAPPAVSLPPTMGQPEPDAANLPVAGGAPAQFAIPPGSTGGGGAAPPAPRERVVASASAAAPRGSDIMLQALQQQARQQKMMQVIGSLGMMANAFNRNPQSQASTRASLAGMIGGGGGGGGDVGTLNALLDMRTKEDEAAKKAAGEETQIEHLMRTNNWDRERAAAMVAAGTADEYLKPDYGIKREEAKKLEAQRLRILANPALIEQMAKDNGISVEMQTEQLKRGDISGVKELSAVAHQRADTAKIALSNMSENQKRAFAADVSSNPEKYATLWGVETDEVRTAAHGGPEGLQKLIEGRAPKKTDIQQDLAVENKMRAAKGLEPLTPAEFKKAGQQPHIEDPNTKIGTEGLKTAVVEYIKNEVPAKVKLAESIASNAQAQDLYRDDLITGGGKISKMTEAGLRTAANLFGLSNDRVANTQVFFNHMRGEAIKIRQESMPGAMSNDDRVFLEELGTGNREWSPDTVRRFLIIQEKYAAAQLWKKNQETMRRKKANPEAYKGADIIPMPAPNRFLKQALASPQGQEALANLKADPSPRNKIVFDEMFGKGRSDYFLEGGE